MKSQVGLVAKVTVMVLALSTAVLVIPGEASAAFGMGRMSFGGGMHSFAGRGMHAGSASRMTMGSHMMGSRTLSSSRSMSRIGRSSGSMADGKAMSRKMSGNVKVARAERLTHGATKPKMTDARTHTMSRMTDRPHRMRLASRPDDVRPHHHPVGPQLRIPNSYGVPNTLLNDQNTIPVGNPPTDQQVNDNAPQPPKEKVTAQSTVERVIENEDGKVVRREWFDPNNKDRIIKKAHYKDGTVVEEEFFDPQDGHRTIDKKYDPKTGRPTTIEYFDKDGKTTAVVQYNGNTGTMERITNFDPQTGQPTSDVWLDVDTGTPVASGTPDPDKPGKLKYVFYPKAGVQP